MKIPFDSIAKLMEYDISTPMSSPDFDDNLWSLLCEKIGFPEKLDAFDLPVSVYFASRYLQWEVGNGGFAQAAYNIPAWFGPAARGYEVLGKPRSAKLIREAADRLEDELKQIQEKGLFETTSIEGVFEHFGESRLSVFNERIIEEEWYIDEERVEYVRANREPFLAVGL